MSEKHQCWVPVLDGKPLLNAVGSNENEVHVNLGLIDLSDDALNRVVVVPATLELSQAGQGKTG